MVVSIVIPTHSRNSLLRLTAESALATLTDIEGEVIIVNDSKNNEVTLPYTKENIKIIKNPKSGAASARNYGAQNAKGEYLFFLDDDIILLPSSISTLLELARMHPRSCFNLNWTLPPQLLQKISNNYFGKYLIHYGFTTLYGWYGLSEQWPENQLISVDSIASYAFFIEKNIFFELNGYDEAIPYAGFEDYILSKKLREANVKMYVYSTVLAYHNEEDRLNLESWLERKYRGGATRAAAVIAGYEELSLRHSLLKRLAYLAAHYSNTKALLLRLTRWLERRNPPLSIYFRFINALLGLYHFDGYYDYIRKYRK